MASRSEYSNLMLGLQLPITMLDHLDCKFSLGLIGVFSISTDSPYK